MGKYYLRCHIFKENITIKTKGGRQQSFVISFIEYIEVVKIPRKVRPFTFFYRCNQLSMASSIVCRIVRV